MATFENTVMIRRPIEDVFAFLSDFENVPKWNYAIVETRKVSEGPVGVGTIYQQVRSVPSRSEESFEVTAYNPPRQLEVQGQLGPFPSRLSYALAAVPEGTRVTNSVELELRGPGRLLGRVAVPCVREAVAANLRRLKELLDDRLWGTLGAQTDGIHGSATDSPGKQTAWWTAVDDVTPHVERPSVSLS